MKMTATQVMALIAAILLLLVFCFAILFVYDHTQKFKAPFAMFYIKHGKQRIFADSQDNQFSRLLKLDVVYTFSNGHGFTYDIIPIKNMDYYVDGVPHQLRNVESLKGCFDEKVTEKSITIDFSKVKIVNVLENKHNAEVFVGQIREGDMFRLIITSDDGKHSIAIDFTVFSEPEQVTLDPGEVVFGGN